MKRVKEVMGVWLGLWAGAKTVPSPSMSLQRRPGAGWLCGLVALAATVSSAQAPDLSADPRVKWLQQSAVRIRTVDPQDENFDDLRPLKQILGDVRIVMLGEISHGDGTSMLAKSRLVKFFHEQMNFDLVVFESGFYDMHAAWSAIRAGQNAVEAVQPALMPVWSHSPQVRELLEYAGRIAQSSRPLSLAGFDLQPGRVSREHLLTDLDSFAGLVQVKSELTTKGTAVREIATNLLNFKYGLNGLPAPDAATRDAFFAAVDQLRDRIAAATRRISLRNDGEYWRQVLSSSLKEYGRIIWYDREHGLDDPDWVAFNMRDKQNADNVAWLAQNTYRGRKILVWGATVHLIRQASRIEATIDPNEPRRSYGSAVPMGEELRRRIGSQIYTIGFTCYEGENGIGAPGDPQGFRSAIRKDQHPSIELEELLNAAGFDFTLLDFHRVSGDGSWLRMPIISRPLGNQGMRAVWPDILDAMFFIRVMEPNGAAR